ncbi:hypothetical protein H4R33_004715 [Dimargaris cristalligena]|nr:hypothetical protein H4R33_004715 [Dimargaris cristalligena]
MGNLKRPKLMARDKDVIDENSKVVYHRLSSTLGFQKRLEDAGTGEVIWQHGSKCPSPYKREFINPRAVTRVVLIQKWGFHRTWYRFTYSGNDYMWKNSSFMSVELKCYQEGSDTVVAEYTDKTGKVNTLNIYPLPGWANDFKELLILTAIDVCETIIDGRSASGGS